MAASRPSATTCSVGALAPPAMSSTVLDGGLGLDHHDGDVVTGDAPGDDHVEHRTLELLVGREGHPLAADEGDAGGADRAGERQAGQLGRHRRGVDRHDVVEVRGVQAHHRDDDLDLVAQALDERGAQRAVDQAAGEDRVLAGPALAAEERAGDAPGGVHPLLDVDRQGEEVELVLGVLAGRRGRQQHGVLVEVGHGGAGGLAGEAPGLEADGAGAVGAVVDDSLGRVDLGTLHGCPPCVLGGSAPVRVLDRSPRNVGGVDVVSPLGSFRGPPPQDHAWGRTLSVVLCRAGSAGCRAPGRT